MKVSKGYPKGSWWLLLVMIFLCIQIFNNFLTFLLNWFCWKIDDAWPSTPWGRSSRTHQNVAAMPVEKDAEYYNMNHKRRGLAFIFNHKVGFRPILSEVWAWIKKSFVLFMWDWMLCIYFSSISIQDLDWKHAMGQMQIETIFV